MRIRIEHTSNPLNYGTNMMVTNFMYYLDKEMDSKNSYYIDVTNDKDLLNYRNQYKEGLIEKHLVDYDFTYAKNIIERINNKIKRDFTNKYATNNLIDKMVSEIDKLVVLGGDDLSEYYSINLLKKEFYRLNKIKEKCDTVLVGQTIGPFYEDRISLAKNTFNNIDIYSRDPWTTKYLENTLKIKGVEESSDLAFLPLPYQDNIKIKENVLNKYNLEEEKYITFVPSGLYKSYCSDKEKYTENLIYIIEYIKNKFNGYKIVLLPHVLRNKDIDDRNIIKEIENKLGKKNEIVYIYDEMKPLKARFILGNGIFTITGRMHGAISTLQMRKPAISISYSVKYKGVIGEGLGLHDLIVEGSKQELWENKKVATDVCNRIEYVINNYNELIKNIDNKVSMAEKNTKLMIENIGRKFMKDLGEK